MEPIIVRMETNDVYKLLKRISPQFSPNLESELNLKEYAFKLATYATFLIYKVGETTKGCIVFYPNSTTSILYIPLFWVDEEFRGQGIAKRMLKEIFWYCKCSNLANIHLEVLKSNRIAFSLYKSVGFTIIEDRSTKFLLQLSVLKETHSVGR